MKRLLYLAAIACITLFAACEKAETDTPIDEEQQEVEITGDLYGIWALTTKSETYPNSEGPQAVYNEDYTPYHFYLALSEFPFPHAIAKKGSLSSLVTWMLMRCASPTTPTRTKSTSARLSG